MWHKMLDLHWTSFIMKGLTKNKSAPHKINRGIAQKMSAMLMDTIVVPYAPVFSKPLVNDTFWSATESTLQITIVAEIK